MTGLLANPGGVPWTVAQDYDETKHPRDELGRWVSVDAAAGSRKLSAEENEAVRTYTGIESQGVNDYLRGGVDTNQDSAEGMVSELVPLLDAAIAATVPLAQDAVLYRGLGNAGKLPAVGRTFSDAAFVSTTKVLEVARRFPEAGPLPTPTPGVVEIRVPAGSRVLDVGGRGLSGMEDEQEVLLPRGARFKVTGWSSKRGTYTVDYLGSTPGPLAVQEYREEEHPRDEAGRWTDSGAAAERVKEREEDRQQAVWDYTNHGHESINKLLRRGPQWMGGAARVRQLREQIKLIDEAIAAQPPLTAPLRVYRVMKRPRGFRQGGIYRDKGFASTTKDADVAYKALERGLGNMVAIITVPKGMRVLEVNLKHGFTSVQPREREVLLPRGLRYKVTHEPTDSVRVVHSVSVPTLWLEVVGVVAEQYSEDQPRDDHGRWTEVSGDTGEDLGKWQEGKQGMLRIFHGTSRGAIQRILKEGLSAQASSRKTWSKAGRTGVLYHGERGQAVFVANRRDTAMWYARQRAASNPVVVEALIPKKQFARWFMRDYEHGGGRGRGAAYTTHRIPPSRIVAFYTRSDPWSDPVRHAVHALVLHAAEPWQRVWLVVEAADYATPVLAEQFNPNHDELGRFATGPGGGAGRRELTEREVDALVSYTSSEPGGAPITEAHKKVLDRAFAAVGTLTKPATVYRGIYQGASKLQVGKTYRPSADEFISTSLKAKVSQDFRLLPRAPGQRKSAGRGPDSALIEIHLPAGARVLNVSARLRAAGMAGFGPNEHEILLPRGSRFKVTGTRGGRVQMDLLPPKARADQEEAEQYEESQHPRDELGRWTDTGAGGEVRPGVSSKLLADYGVMIPTGRYARDLARDAKDIQAAWTKAERLVPWPRVTTLRYVPPSEMRMGPGCVAEYDPRTKELRVNTKTGAGNGKLQDLSYRVGFSSTSGLQGTLLHEMVHSVHDLPEDLTGHWPQEKVKRAYEKTVAAQVSGYATYSPGEFVAECGAGLLMGKKYDRDVMWLYRKYEGPRIKGVRGTGARNEAAEDFDPDQPRDERGRWTDAGGGGGAATVRPGVGGDERWTGGPGPADTVEEWLHQDFGVKIKGRDAPVDRWLGAHAEELRGALTLARERLDPPPYVKTLNFIPPVQFLLLGYIAGYHGGVLTVSRIGDWDAVNQRGVDQGWHTSTDALLHELVHGAHEAATEGKLPKDWKHLSDMKAAARVSGYAKENPTEFVAETATGILHGKTYDSEIMALYRKYKGPKIKEPA